METFKDFYSRSGKKPKSQRKKRHEGSFDLQPTDRKSTNFVPVYHQTKHENQKYKRVKDGVSNKEFLRDAEVRELKKKFGFKPSSSNVIGLGNTGIKLVKHPRGHPRGWILTNKDVK